MQGRLYNTTDDRNFIANLETQIHPPYHYEYNATVRMYLYDTASGKLDVRMHAVACLGILG